MPKVTYRGNPGYTFFPVGGEAFTPVPGETLELPADVVATLGDEFDRAGRSSTVGEFDLAKARKAELVTHAETLGLVVDEDATVADLRAAIEAHTVATVTTDDDTNPTGQEAD